MSVFAEIGPPKNEIKIESADALNSDIIKAIHKNFAEAKRQTSVIANRFRGNTREDEAENVWRFLRTRIHYKKDGSDQVIKLPRKFLADRSGDCKSYSLFAASVLANLGHPVKFRYASYSGSPIPSHVYCITQSETANEINGNEIICDGVYSLFNEEKEPTHKKDYAMRVITMSGIGEQPGNVYYEDITGIAGRKHKKDKDGKPKRGKQVLFAPARGPFLLLVEANVHGLASKLQKAIAKNPAAIREMWVKKLGGDYGKLVSTVNAGAKRKKILGIGIITVSAVAATITASAPVLYVVVDQLKKLGLNKESDGSSLDELETKSSDALDEKNISDEDIKDASNEQTSFSLSPVMIIGLAAAAVFLLRK